MTRREDTSHDGTPRMTFAGFDRPDANWFRMPNAWTDITAAITNIAELKVVEYILRHTWGYREYGVKKHITIDEFVQGRKRDDGSRMDQGTGLSERAVRYGLDRALLDGLISEDVDDRDRARVKKYFGLRMRKEAESIDAQHDVQAGVQSVHPEVQSLPARGAEFAPRTEKDTAERHSEERNADDVVAALIAFGVTPWQAMRLATVYEPAKVLAKLDVVRYLESIKSPLVARNAPGFLIRAIENDYSAPKGYHSRQEPQQQAQDRGQQGDELAQAEAAHRQASTAFTQRQPAKRIIGTDLTTANVWQRAKAWLALQRLPLMLDLCLKSAILLDCDGNTATIGTPYPYHAEQLTKSLPIIDEALTHILGHALHTQIDVVPFIAPDTTATAHPVRTKRHREQNARNTASDI